jgi:hypothetical protein
MWEPAKSRRIFRTRVVEREVTLSDGARIVARMRIAPSTEGTLTTEEQRHFYGLVRIWEEGGRLVEAPTYFSLQGLARTLRKRWGSRTIETMTQSLTRLLATTLFWENAYYDKNAGETKKELHGFHILEELHIVETRKDGHVTREACYFRFNTFILNNLIANYTKPVLLDTVLNFESEIAQILYTYLDLMLADKELFRRRTRELFAELGLDGSAYRNASDRRRTLERVIKELEGVPITTGYLVSVTLERTVDGKDYNLVVRKGRARPKPVPAASPSVSAAEPQSLGAAEQVRFFYETFFQSGRTAQPSEKELQHAGEHLKRYGQEGARYLVLFARREAPKTKFDIQSYGGICGYEARAMKEFQRKRQKEHGSRLEKARKSHYARFYAAYQDYLREMSGRMEKLHSEAFVAFLDHDAQERTKYVRQRLNVYLRTTFDTEEDRLNRLAEFFRNHPDHPVLDFWQWDAARNPDKFEPEKL